MTLAEIEQERIITEGIVTLLGWCQRPPWHICDYTGLTMGPFLLAA